MSICSTALPNAQTAPVERVERIKNILRSLKGRRSPPTLLEVLQRTPLEELERTVARLKTRNPASEVRQACIDLLCLAPIEHFGVLRQVFMKQFGDKSS